MIIINPGSGPVDDASAGNARENMQQFVEDIMHYGYGEEAEVLFSGTPPEDQGRYTFDILVDGREYEIDMPGIPLEQVRYLQPTDEPEFKDQNIWHFPRLYVDGSSWVWYFAIGACRPDEDED